MNIKKYNKKDTHVVEYYFENIDRFINYILNAEINCIFFNKDELSSNDSRKSKQEFCKTSSFDEAVRLCEYGWNEKFDRFLYLKSEIDKEFLDIENVIGRKKDIVGFAPSVPDYVHMNPNNMLRRVFVPNYSIINIYVNISCPYETSSREIYNRGAIIISIIDLLEKMGYAVNLVLFKLAFITGRGFDEALLLYFNVKEENENINLKKVYFPLCHPSFLRRLCFRVTEVAPLRLDWSDTYGEVASRKQIIDFFGLKDTDIIFSFPREMGIHGSDDIISDLKRCL